ncbi:rhodanese-related (seleno)protein [Megalodesulfovibrio gigas]|uniref:rhodanese-related (seleno)protein n=1 Tax=Megalodesulfovibrio gigas TaxID=879 RepID=UPI000417DEE2|nr:rhodanese-related (seleno)protein [Megalodesulfovibrio gigas]
MTLHRVSLSPRTLLWLTLALALMLAQVVPALAASKDAPAPTKEMIGRMTIEELAGRLDDPAIVILDARTGSSWEHEKTKIKGAVRHEPRQAGEWAKTLDKSRHYVLYCTCYDESTSLRVGLKLLENGVPHVYALVGGWDAWVDAGLPVEPKEAGSAP